MYIYMEESSEDRNPPGLRRAFMDMEISHMKRKTSQVQSCLK